MVAEKEGREAAGFESSFKESPGVKRLEQSVSRFDMQVAKTNQVPGKGFNSPVSSIGEIQIIHWLKRPHLIISWCCKTRAELAPFSTSLLA